MVDIGSGAGFPGVILGIAMPETNVTLVDSNHKKGAFLREVSSRLGLKNISVITTRVEDYKPVTRYCLVISRAFASLHVFLLRSKHLCTKNGSLVAMKGHINRDEVGAIPQNILQRIIPVEVPFLHETRNLVFMSPSVGEGSV